MDDDEIRLFLRAKQGECPCKICINNSFCKEVVGCTPWKMFRDKRKERIDQVVKSCLKKN